MEFKENDLVIYATGLKGKITEVCHCTECEKRGFYECVVKREDGSTDYITNYDKHHDFERFFLIGDTLYKNKVRPAELEVRIAQIDAEREALGREKDLLRKQIFRLNNTMIVKE